MANVVLMTQLSIRDIISKCGGTNRTASLLGLRPPSISGWIKRGKVPASQVFRVSSLSGVPVKDIRPDLIAENKSESEPA